MRRIGLLVVVLVAVLAAEGPAAVPLLDINAGLAGVVLADDIVKVGATVARGQPLVYVQTETQPKAIAARAPVEALVREVLAKPEQRVEQGEVIVRLEPRGGNYRR